MRWAALVMLVGCIGSGDTRCPDGTVCPDDSVCREIAAWAPGNATIDTPLCIPAANVDACRDALEGDPCTPLGHDEGTGACHSGACFFPECGNHVLDAGEACDDANLESGDGCAFGCASDETCGNGTIDFAAGENCDDSNPGPHDGCSTTCEVERSRWTLVGQGQSVVRHVESAMVFDAWRRQFVMFGGGEPGGSGSSLTAGSGLDDTVLGELACPSGACIEWRVAFLLTTRPPGRAAHVMAFDDARGVTVMFGGSGGGIVLDDTWEWDGRRWVERSPSDHPERRFDAAMAYDPRRKVVVLFGGTDGSQQFADTWEWDGTTWSRKSPTSSPPELAGHAMTFDPRTGTIVLVGNGETWEYDGTTWRERSTATSPPGRVDFGLTFDVASQRVLLYGGISLGNPVADSWLWDGVAGIWTEVPGASPAVGGIAVATDPDQQLSVVVGGNAAQPLAWTGTQWAPTPAQLPQPPAGESVAAYDRARDRVVMFTDSHQIWERARSTWLDRTPTTSPPNSNQIAITYDQDARRILVVSANELWSWDGASWTPLGPTPALSNPSLAYDPVEHRTVLFGSLAAPLRNAMHAWDGSSWSELAPAHVPSPRDNVTVVYDERRHELVMFGGNAGAMRFDETWVFTGGDWVQRFPAHRPNARFDYSATWNLLRGRVAIFGGSGGVPLFDAWEWTGEDWEAIDVDIAPTARALAAFSASRDGLVLFGGGLIGGVSAPLRDTWTLQYEAFEPVLLDACIGRDTDGDGLVGCADPDCSLPCELCGDHVADPIETCNTCSADVATCTPVCGDLICDDEASCPGDCP